ncbi:haloacid dehalogenase-like hydrolase [Kineococcus esterisolvens]|uniref:haloacid dehalogenase-like hydrolase n=1 Tax=unclassified Kineococcus TaxID=2621656 RepID=UPI003D7CB0D1
MPQQPCVVLELDDTLVAEDRVVIATACAEPLAREVCRASGLQDVEVVAGSFTTHRWRLPHAVPARSHQEVQALQDAGTDLPVDHAYSDSVSDLPLLQTARTLHLVRPSERHLPVLLRELGQDAQVIR